MCQSCKSINQSSKHLPIKKSFQHIDPLDFRLGHHSGVQEKKIQSMKSRGDKMNRTTKKRINFQGENQPTFS